MNTSKLNQLIDYLWLGTLLSLPLSVGLNSVCVGVLFFLTVVKWVKTPIKHKLTDHLTLLSPIFIFIALALSLIYTEDMALGLDMVFRKNAYILLPIIVFVNQDLFRERVGRYFATYLFGLTLSGLGTLILYLVPEPQLMSFLEGKEWLRDYTPSPNRHAFGIYTPFMDRLHFGYLLGLGGILHLWFLLKRKVNLIGSISFFIILLTLVIVGARGAQLAFAIAAFFIIVFWYLSLANQSQTNKVLVGISLLSGFVLVPWLLYQFVPAVSDRYIQLAWELDIYLNKDISQYDYANFTSVRRIFSWINTRDLVTQNWIFGVGIGDVVTDLEGIYKAKGLNCPVNSHNQFLLYWVSAGLFGLVSSLFTFISYFISIWQKKASITQIIALSFMLYYLVIFLFDVPLWYSVGINGFFVFFGMFLIMKSEEKDEKNRDQVLRLNPLYG